MFPTSNGINSVITIVQKEHKVLRQHAKSVPPEEIKGGKIKKVLESQSKHLKKSNQKTLHDS